jgi:hypothetical protein
MRTTRQPNRAAAAVRRHYNICDPIADAQTSRTAIARLRAVGNPTSTEPSIDLSRALRKHATRHQVQGDRDDHRFQ